jgi:GeoRSP system radical SAM/SPASM protein
VELSAPLTVNWTLSYACNFSCRHCYSRGQTRRELPLARVLDLVDELARCRVAFVNFGGGEPLLYPHLLEVAHRATSAGLRVTMNTNGWLVDSDAARSLREAGFRSVGVSLDGPTPEVHDAFRNRPGSFDRALAALEALAAAGVPTTASTVVFRGNVSSYRRVVELAAGRGAGTVYLHNFKCSGRGMENREELDLDPEEWRDFYEDALAYRAEAPAKLAFDDPILALLGASEPGAVKGSTCGKLSLHLEPDGEATPCGFIPVYLGNVLEVGLETLWRDSPILRGMRQKQPQGKCRSCSSYGDCLGGCTARAFAVSGSFDAPDPHCWREEGTPPA